MYLYLGQETVVSTKDIIGIFDLENTSKSHLTRDYLTHAQKSGAVAEICSDIPKSFVVVERGGKNTVYLSQISPATLSKRVNYMKELSNL